MNESQRITLQRYRRRLADDIIMTEEFLAQLIEENIFEWGMVSVIKAEKTESEQIYKMLELLPKRGPLAYDRFISVLERDYPWLATLLLSSSVKSTPVLDTRESIRQELVHSGTEHSRTISEGCDVDIKKLVASFAHRQFGQSKRIGEKDKKAVVKFLTEQLQQERTRYQSMLPSSQAESCASPMSDEDEVFQAMEIQEHLFRIHMKIEPHLRDDNDEDDDDGENNGKSQGCSIRERILPDDLSFQVIHKEMDLLSKKLYRLEGMMRRSLDHFKPEMQRTPLNELVGRMHEVLRKQQHELVETEETNRRMLGECHDYSEHIEKLEKERREYRAQVNVLHQDMAKVRQEKMALHERCLTLEKNHKERLEKESTLDNLRLLVKDLRSNGLTPRQGMSIMEDGGRGGQARRSMRGSQVRQGGVNYPLYARKFTTSTRTTTKKRNNNLSTGQK